jgi:hypothetical protein
MMGYFGLPLPPLAQAGEVIHEITMGTARLLIAGQNRYRLFGSCFKVSQPGDEAPEFKRLRVANQEFSEEELKGVS